VVCIVSFLPKLSWTMKGFNNDSRTLVLGSMCMGMEKLLKSLGGTINQGCHADDSGRTDGRSDDGR
jgi:hypothetical protein